MDQRTQFIADHLRDSLSITELCELYGVSRKTGYKWIDRYLRHGPAGLEERSRRPRRSPRHTSEEIVTAILDARRRHPRWGGKKLLALLHKRHPRWVLPGRSTACDILSRHGMVPIRRQRRRLGHPGKPTSQMLAPNDVWTADYKGQFRTGDGRYCYPLTVADGFSRYLLGCQALTSTAVDEAKPIFTLLFDVAPDPGNVRLLGPGAHVPGAECVADAVEEARARGFRSASFAAGPRGDVPAARWQLGVLDGRACFHDGHHRHSAPCGRGV
jgi:transposase